MIDESAPTPARRANTFVRFTRGEERLWHAFWLLYMAGAIVVQFVVLAIAWTGAPGVVLPGALAVLPVVLVPLAYKLWAAVCVWFCAFNVNWRPWAYAARAAVVAGIMIEGWRSYGVIRSEIL